MNLTGMLAVCVRFAWDAARFLLVLEMAIFSRMQINLVLKESERLRGDLVKVCTGFNRLKVLQSDHSQEVF